MAEQRYRVEVASEFLRFGAAHFIAFPGFREPLHGHNYQLSARVDAALKRITTEEGDRFVFPRKDCALLPIVHSSAEEIASCLLGRVRQALAAELAGRSVRAVAVAVGVAEAPGQMAWCEEIC